MLNPGHHSYPPVTVAWSVWGLGALLYLIGFYQRVAPAVMTDQLMSEFAIGATELGNLSAFYFYSYVAMQIPTGILADRWGPRRLLTAGAAVAAIGTALFAVAADLWWANAGRLLIGASVAVAFVSMLKLATHWFAPRQFALASGLALLFGVVGGVIAGVPLGMLIEAWGWRPVMGASAAITALLSVTIWLRVRDDPHDLAYLSHAPATATGKTPTPILRGMAEVLSYRNIWILLVTPIGIAGAVLTFAGLWGVPYLRQVHGLETRAAATITSLLLIAWAVGGPVLGALSERMGRRRPLYVATTAAALAGWAVIIFLPIPVWLMIVTLLLTGFFSGNLIIGFAFAKESVPARLMGTASGICNMGPLLGGMLLQPTVGWVLDRNWLGATAAGARIYDATAYQAGFSLMAACLVVSLCLIPFARETYGRQTG
ncbi:MFS transporter [Accumulibacter sp.]|uniref:Lysosomal dipeptide transporter MFSD1 n=1 Tax=Candidatus Accumulibacter proximus TaxID=2954385 RepID=A0A935UER1_9PROT|nr:MFS transporter [Accumulibacter sp.]MBK7673837.1 MFS transporter [Candidatus Accumulibacter proximus]MBL8373747.1 MFS transporter [Accumulibacter sp.]